MKSKTVKHNFHLDWLWNRFLLQGHVVIRAQPDPANPTQTSLSKHLDSLVGIKVHELLSVSGHDLFAARRKKIRQASPLRRKCKEGSGVQLCSVANAEANRLTSAENTSIRDYTGPLDRHFLGFPSNMGKGGGTFDRLLGMVIQLSFSLMGY